MGGVVGELVALVGGSTSAAAQKKAGNGSTHSAAQKTHSLSQSDNAFHQIARGTEKKVKATAEKAIPFGDDKSDDIENFNS